MIQPIHSATDFWGKWWEAPRGAAQTRVPQWSTARESGERMTERNSPLMVPRIFSDYNSPRFIKLCNHIWFSYFFPLATIPKRSSAGLRSVNILFIYRAQKDRHGQCFHNAPVVDEKKLAVWARSQCITCTSPHRSSRRNHGSKGTTKWVVI